MVALFGSLYNSASRVTASAAVDFIANKEDGFQLIIFLLYVEAVHRQGVSVQPDQGCAVPDFL